MICTHNTLLKLFICTGIFFSCSTAKQPQQMDTKQNKNTVTQTDTVKPVDLIESLLKEHPAYFGDILKNRNGMNIQVIYTQINRTADGMPAFRHYYFNADKDKYFYPASTVKLPVVLLALQKLNELKDKHISRNTSMLTGASFSGHTAVFNDPTAPGGKPSIAHYIKKILLVSDNDAYNRLYEFLGQEYINTEMKKKGYAGTEIIHRLNIFLSEEENRRTNTVKFYDSSSNLIYEQPAQRSNFVYAARKDSIGKAHYSAGKLINRPMDCSKKNRLLLEDLHNIVISILFPDAVKASQRFNISEDDRQFVLKYMSQYPTESTSPPYADEPGNYWQGYSKFLLFGAGKEKLPQHIRIFNKEGDAYGHLIDAAYIVDYKNKVEFFISAVIYCNSDGILNDDKYDYDTVGMPFLKNLGQVIYEYELKRDYKFRPNLSPVLFTYDK